MPQIDPMSVVLFAAGSVVIALVLCVALRRHKRGDGAIKWLMASNLAFLVAGLGVLGRGLLGFQGSAVLVIAAAYLAITAAYFAVLKAEERPLPWVRLGSLGVLTLAGQAWLASMVTDVVPLMLSSSLVNSLLLGAMMVHVWQLTRRYGDRIASLMCLPFAALFLGYAVRLPVAIIWPEGDAAVTTSLMVIVAMAWSAVILELAMIALREVQARVRLKAALEQVEAAQAARTRFLLAISHDLRTPLNAILGLSELMRHQAMGALPEPYQAQAEHLHKNGTELNELVQDLLIHAEAVGSGEARTDAEGIDTAVAEKFREAG